MLYFAATEQLPVDSHCIRELNLVAQAACLTLSFQVLQTLHRLLIDGEDCEQPSTRVN